jgi:hypothetical protein
LGINLAELIDKLEMIEALTLIGVTEPRSTSHQQGSDERLSLNCPLWLASSVYITGALVYIPN